MRFIKIINKYNLKAAVAQTSVLPNHNISNGNEQTIQSILQQVSSLHSGQVFPFFFAF